MMPEIGEIIPRKGSCHRKFMWHACVECGQPRWVGLYRGEARSSICKACANKALGERNKNNRYHCLANGMWKGGKSKDSAGYILIMLSPNDFFYPMANRQGYVREHRLVVAKALGRCLHLWEIVHHKGTKYPKGSKEDKADNRYPENLQLVSDDRHKQITILENRIAFLEKRVTLLEAENALTPRGAGVERWRPTKQR